MALAASQHKTPALSLVVRSCIRFSFVLLFFQENLEPLKPLILRDTWILKCELQYSTTSDKHVNVFEE